MTEYEYRWVSRDSWPDRFGSWLCSRPEAAAEAGRSLPDSYLVTIECREKPKPRPKYRGIYETQGFIGRSEPFASIRDALHAAVRAIPDHELAPYSTFSIRTEVEST